MQEKPVTKINVTYNVALVTLDSLPNEPGIVSDILNAIANESINIDMITQGPPYKGNLSLSFTIPADDVAKALGALNPFRKTADGLKIEIDAENTKFQVYGEGMRSLPGVAARLFAAMARDCIEIKLVTTSEIDISLLLYSRDVDKALVSIESEFGLKML